MSENSVMRVMRCNIPAKDKFPLLTLAYFDGKDGIRPAVKSVAKLLGKEDVRNVRRILKRLESEQYITVITKGNKSPNTYAINWNKIDPTGVAKWPPKRKIYNTIGGRNGPPCLAEVLSHCENEMGIGYDYFAESFFDTYSESDWTIRGQPIRDWKHVFRVWMRDNAPDPDYSTILVKK